MTRARDLADGKHLTNVDSNTLVVDATNNRVGVGTASPTRDISIVGTATSYINLIGSTTSGIGMLLGDTDAEIRGAFIYDNSADRINLRAGGNTTRVSIDSDGLKFGSDTAAANALDDYEEGTWTPAVSTASTTHSTTGIYTKVGNIVSIQGVIHFTQSGTTFGSISGLPFVVATVNYTPLAFREWYSTGNALFGNLVVGGQSTSGFYNSANSSTATNGQQYGFAIQAVYRT